VLAAPIYLRDTQPLTYFLVTDTVNLKGATPRSLFVLVIN